eukprot:g1660.t1
MARTRGRNERRISSRNIAILVFCTCVLCVVLVRQLTPLLSSSEDYYDSATTADGRRMIETQEKLKEMLFAVRERNTILERDASKWSRMLREAAKKSASSSKSLDINFSNGRGEDDRQLRIYVYDLPSPFTDGAVQANAQCSPNAPKIDWQTKYSTEVYIHQRLLKSPLRTLDPEEADLFYVPVYTSCYLHARATKFVKGYVYIYKAYLYVRQKYPYWNRTLGRDHVWTFSHDMGGCVAPYEELRNSIWITTTGEMTSRKGAYTNYTKIYDHTFYRIRDFGKPCFSPWKDVVMPPMLRDPLVLEARQPSGELMIARKRDVLASFRGAVMKSRTYSRGIRQLWSSIYRDDSEVRVHVVNPNHEKEPNYKFNYFDDMATSTFCLCPPGWASWTPRVFEAIILSCIPVIVSDANKLPFETRTNYSDIAVFVPEKDAGRVKEILKAIPQTRIESMRRGLAKVWQRFLYDETASGDAFDFIMMDLADRWRTIRKNSRIANSFGGGGR